MSNKKRTLESIADQTAEMWENGNPSKEIVDVIAKEVGGVVCDTPMRAKAAGMYGIEAFHPFNLANVDVNVVRNFCRAIHDFGRSRFAAYKTVLMSEGVFSQEVRTAVWMDYIGITECGSPRSWLLQYLKLYVAMRADGFKIVRNISLGIIGHVRRAYNASERLWQAFEDDDVAQFELLRMVEGMHFNKTCVCDMLLSHRGGKQVLANLIKTGEAIAAVFPLKEMLFYVCSSCADPQKSVAVVNAISEVAPQSISTVDPFGLTPLDYINFHNLAYLGKRRGVYEDYVHGCCTASDVLSAALVKLGCNPNHKNKYGISTLDVRRQMHSYGAMRRDWSDWVDRDAYVARILKNARREAPGKVYWEINAKGQEDGKSER